MRILMALLLVTALLSAGVRAQGPSVDNVVIVLDASGSMNDRMGNVRKIDAAKVALKEVLKNIPQSTQVGLLVFSAANVKDWAYPLGPRDDQKLNAAIDLPEPKLGTPLGTFMKMGADKLLEARKAQFGYGSYRLLVVTDGEANSEPSDLVDKYTREIITRGIVVDVIGVKMDKAHTLATKANSYRNASDPAALQRAVQEVFAEVGKTKDGQVGEDSFAIIAPIPPEIVSVVIRTISTISNDPIGAPPAMIVRPPAAIPSSGPASRSNGIPFSRAAVLFIGLIVLFWLIKKSRR